jgi:hypothetical protein
MPGKYGWKEILGAQRLWAVPANIFVWVACGEERDAGLWICRLDWRSRRDAYVRNGCTDGGQHSLEGRPAPTVKRMKGMGVCRVDVDGNKRSGKGGKHEEFHHARELQSWIC